MKIIYISNSIDSAFNSQVLELLAFLIKQNVNVNLIVCAKKEPNISIDGLTVYCYKSVPDYPGVEIYHKRKLKEIFSKIGIDEHTIIHTRGHLPAYFSLLALAQSLKNIKILPDFRGVIIEEIKQYYALNPLLKMLKLRLFESAYKKMHLVNSFSAVSKALKNYVIEKCGSKEFSFINTCISGDNFIFDKAIRELYRDKLNINKGEILLVFSSGGNGNWQQSDEIIEYLKALPIKILVLGSTGESTSQITRLKVPYTEVAYYLNAADVGILFRRKDMVNHVAAPIKFSEYMSCGLPVIANDSIDSVVEIIEQTGMGKIINEPKCINMEVIQKLLKMDREEISRKALNQFGINKIGSQYLDCYYEILHKTKQPAT
jgi:glycosyltransferase involved in cell wall biosynthesis